MVEILEENKKYTKLSPPQNLWKHKLLPNTKTMNTTTTIKKKKKIFAWYVNKELENQLKQKVDWGTQNR